MDWAARWRDLGQRVLDQAHRWGTEPMIPPEVWAAAAEADTWRPGPTGDPDVASARILGGFPSEVPDDPDGEPVGPCPTLVVGLWLWQQDRGAIKDGTLAGREPHMLAAAIGGLPPWATGGPGPHPLVVRLAAEMDPDHGLRPLGGAALEVLRVASTTGDGAGGTGRWARAVRALIEGTGPVDPDDIVGDVVLVHTPEVPGSPVPLRVEELVTIDPRLAVRVLDRLWGPGWVTGPLLPHTTEWFELVAAAVAVDGRGVRLLVECLDDETDDGWAAAVTRMALRHRGLQVGAPPRWGRWEWYAPVAWYRWALRTLTFAPDRVRAAQAVETSWARLSGEPSPDG